MNFKRISGIVLIIIGIAMVLFSNYISQQVLEGKGKIAKAQQQVNQGNSLFSLSPATKQIGQGITGSAQRKIDAGKQTVSEYETLANRLKMGGIIIAVIGAGLFLFSFSGKKKGRG